MENTTESPVQAKKKTAKKYSLRAQVVAALWVVGWCSYKFIRFPDTMTIKAICVSGLVIAGCFSAVYFNIFMDKIRDIKISSK